MQTSRSGEVRDQWSVVYRSEKWTEVREFREHYTSMFIEDVSQRVLSRPLRRGSSEDWIALTPDKPEVADVITAGLDISWQGYGRGDLAEALSEFFRMTMVEICITKCAVFEIVFLRPSRDSEPDRFQLVHVNPQQLKRRWGKLYQVVDKVVAEERGVDQLIYLPNSRLAVFSLPEPLDRRLRCTIERLSLLSRLDWHPLSLEARKRNIPYDFLVHKRSMQLALAEACRPTGWPARGSFNEEVFNFFSLRQDFLFSIFALEVREALLAQMNVVLDRVGPVLGWTAAVSVNGMASRSELDGAIAELGAGKRSFIEIMDSVS